MSMYEDFLRAKDLRVPPTGIPDARVEAPWMFPHQNALTGWSLRRGRSATFADTGLGKMRMAIAWADAVARHTDAPVLILTPLAVTSDFVREGQRIGVEVVYAREPGAAGRLTVTNYDMLAKFNPAKFGGVALDESSVLKDETSARRNELIEAFAATPFRSCYTATPSPNDHTELGNHAEFLGIMRRVEMLAKFFVHDGGSTQNWDLKGHAREAFWRWVCSWAALVKSPADLGFDASAYDLPPLVMHDHVVAGTREQAKAQGKLFAESATTLTEQRAARKATMNDRVRIAADLVAAEPDEPWVIWCELNAEAEALAKACGERGVNVYGSMKPDEKEWALAGFSAIPRRHDYMITKPKIAGFGLNWQHCARVAFVGVSHCYDETTEVLTRRGWLTFDKVTIQDEVATVRQEDRSFEWQRPTDVIWQPYEGDMIHFVGQRNFDLLVTPNHNMFVDRCKVRFQGDDSTWHLKPASEIADRYRRQEWRMCSVPSSYQGERAERVRIPIPEDLCINSRTKIVESISIEDMMRLAGWYISEGHARPLDTEHAGQICICQTDQHPENRDEIISLLRRIGLEPNFKTKDIMVYSKQLATFLHKEFGHLSDRKRIPRWMLDLDADLLVILRDTLIKGDGCHSEGVCRFYRTNSKELADGFQELCIKTGVRGSVHERTYENSLGTFTFYDVMMAREQLMPAIHKQPMRVGYRGMVGCVTVPNHTVIVRRNGIPVISGNSFEQWYQAIRRCWRFGQTRPVHCHVITSELEGAVLENLRRKEADARVLAEEMRRYTAAIVQENVRGAERESDAYDPKVEMRIPAWMRSDRSAA